MNAHELAERIDAIVLEHERTRLRLKPCPFCGCDRVEETDMMGILCLGCSAITQFTICSTDAHARRLWNTRHASITPRGSTRWR